MKYPTIRYVLHMPNKLPMDRVIGTSSLLFKLIRATLEFLKKSTDDSAKRREIGVYELKEQMRYVANARNNLEKVDQALTVRENKHITRDDQTVKIHDEKNPRPYYPSTVAGLRDDAEDAITNSNHEGMFKMGQPFEQY